MTRSITVLVVATLVALSTQGAVAGVIDRRSLVEALRADRGSRSDSTDQLPDPGITIGRVRLEPGPASPDSQSVVLKFDLRNGTATNVTDIVVSVSLFGSATSDVTPRPMLVRPFKVRVGGPLRAGYSLGYQIQLKNLSLDPDCVPEIEIVSARSIDDPLF
jgi:hypothetical protein